MFKTLIFLYYMVVILKLKKKIEEDEVGGKERERES